MPRKKAATKRHDESLDSKLKDGEVVPQLDYEPFACNVTIRGIAPILFHRYDQAEVDRKAAMPKGAAGKKEDNIESYIYYNNKKQYCMPGANFKAALKNAAKRFQDPSSPRRSAHDMVAAGITVQPFLAPIKKDGKIVKKYDAIDVRSVVIGKIRISRSRPMLEEGWMIDFEVAVNDSENITSDWLYKLIARAGKFSGLGDFRPDFGGFRIESFKKVKLV